MSNDFDPIGDINVERLMEEIGRRAERQRASLPLSSPMMTTVKPAPDTMEKGLNDALRAQVALNAVIVDSLASLVRRLDRANRDARHVRQELAEKPVPGDALRLGLADDVSRLQGELVELRDTTERLEQRTAELLSCVENTGQQLDAMALALDRADDLSARILALEEIVQALTVGSMQ